MIDTKINLCDQCPYDFAVCQPEHIEFGDGVSNDNVIVCSSYPYEQEGEI